jgi:glutamine synthetase adenylyltransferase
VLGSAGFLKKKMASRIEENLGFMRKLETFVRINSEMQDFILPAEPDRLQLIAASMHFNSARRLRASVQKVKKENRKLFLAQLKSLPQ